MKFKCPCGNDRFWLNIWGNEFYSGEFELDSCGGKMADATWTVECCECNLFWEFKDTEKLREAFNKNDWKNIPSGYL